MGGIVEPQHFAKWSHSTTANPQTSKTSSAASARAQPSARPCMSSVLSRSWRDLGSLLMTIISRPSVAQPLWIAPCGQPTSQPRIIRARARIVQYTSKQRQSERRNGSRRMAAADVTAVTGSSIVWCSQRDDCPRIAWRRLHQSRHAQQLVALASSPTGEGVSRCSEAKRPPLRAALCVSMRCCLPIPPPAIAPAAAGPRRRPPWRPLPARAPRG